MSRKPRSPGWIPNYHGGWAMIAMPPLLQMWVTGFHWKQLPLLALWWVGYFLFFATGLWLRSRRRPKYWPPVRAYAIAVAALGAAVLATSPRLTQWAALYLPLILATAYYSTQRKDRSLSNDFVTTAAASLMAPATLHAATGGNIQFTATGQWGHAWLLAAIMFAYFAGTVFYVKTLVRERGSDTYLALSIGWHAASLAGAIWCAVAGSYGWFLAVVAAGVLARAGIVPLRARSTGRPPGLKAVGMWEIATAAAVAVAIMVG